MAVKDIILLGDKRLYEISQPVQREEIKELTPAFKLMAETIVDFRNQFGTGRAIAAPQIGLMKRVICLNIETPVFLINPELSDLSNEKFEMWDDCMSFPNLLVKINRHKSLTISFLDLNFEKHTWQLNGDLSELIQHEYDHLDGILAIQRAIDKKSFRWKK